MNGNDQPKQPAPEDRKHINEAAGHWFRAARQHQAAGRMDDALMCMENAYNHLENLLAVGMRLTVQNIPGKKQGWEHSEQVLVWYPALPEANLTDRYSVAYYHYNPPFNGPNWVDFFNPGRIPERWWYLPLVAVPKAEAERALNNLQDEIWASFHRYSKKLNWGLTGMQPECWIMLDAAVSELAGLRVLFQQIATAPLAEALKCSAAQGRPVNITPERIEVVFSQPEGGSMGIPVESEPMGLGTVLERCFRCAMPTSFWYRPNNVACCPDCALLLTPEQVPTHEQWMKEHEHIKVSSLHDLDSQWYHADGNCCCRQCGNPYRSHQSAHGYLTKLCDGTLVKL